MLIFLIIFCLAGGSLCGWYHGWCKYKDMLMERNHYYDIVCALIKGYCDCVFNDVVDLQFRIKTEGQPVQLEVCFLSESIEDELPEVEWISEVVLPEVESEIYFKYVDELYKKIRQVGMPINCEFYELDPTKRFVSIIEKEVK